MDESNKVQRLYSTVTNSCIYTHRDILVRDKINQIFLFDVFKTDKYDSSTKSNGFSSLTVDEILSICLLKIKIIINQIVFFKQQYICL